MIRDIAGRQNHSVKLLRKLQQKKHRRERGLLVCEGMDLLTAAVEAGASIQDVLVRRDLFEELPKSLVETAGAGNGGGETPDIGVCDAATLEYSSSLGGASDVVFSCVQPDHSLSDLALESGTTFYLDGVGDPGNVGTIVRSALAFDLVGVVCAPGTADPFGPKAMRAGMGAQFLMRVVTEVPQADLIARLDSLEERGEASPEVWIAEPHEGLEASGAPLGQGCLVVLGSERTGPSDTWKGTRRVSVPQGRSDSLNVAMAGTVLAYESWLRRSTGPR